MEFDHDTTFDAGTDTSVDNFGADHDGGLGDTAGDDHYSMVANDDSGSDHSDYGDNSYGDSSSSDDSSSAAGGSSGESSATGSSTVSIAVDGHTYTEAATTDSDGDAVARISLPDGDTVMAVDTDHDGQADGAAIIGSDGKVIDVQHEDKSTGEWIDDGVPGSDSSDSNPAGDSTSTTGDSSSSDSYPSDTSSSDSSSSDSYPSDTSSDGDSSSTTGPADGSDGSDGVPPASTAAGTISIDAGGQHFEGAETIDVNQDGHADSAVVEADGKTYLLTDFDGDGHADHVEVGQDGQWKGGYSVSDSGQFTPDPGTTPDENDIPNNYAVDPQTGEWVSNNN
ncbi:MAG TPA: hypothetical protein VHX59_12915 [Mycobacteriales bacterium]|jgi:hypothetical protein|nr:hypothetical protein [Mycobacteriales bacterium]